jgi:hypothetical protein
VVAQCLHRLAAEFGGEAQGGHRLAALERGAVVLCFMCVCVWCVCVGCVLCGVCMCVEGGHRLAALERGAVCVVGFELCVVCVHQLNRWGKGTGGDIGAAHSGSIKGGFLSVDRINQINQPIHNQPIHRDRYPRHSRPPPNPFQTASYLAHKNIIKRTDPA